jgi:hypothetical protein
MLSRRPDGEADSLSFDLGSSWLPGLNSAEAGLIRSLTSTRALSACLESSSEGR